MRPTPGPPGVIAAGAIAGVALALSACGGSGPPAPLAPADAARLHAEVAAIRQAAQSGRSPTARAAVGALRTELAALQQAGRLAPGDAANLEAGARQAQAQLVSAPATSSTPTSTQSLPTTTPATPSTTTLTPAQPGRAAPGRGHDKGHGGHRDGKRVMAATELGPGAAFGTDGRYRIERLLSAGGMATVWPCHRHPPASAGGHEVSLRRARPRPRLRHALRP